MSELFRRLRLPRWPDAHRCSCGLALVQVADLDVYACPHCDATVCRTGCEYCTAIGLDKRGNRR